MQVQKMDVTPQGDANDDGDGCSPQGDAKDDERTPQGFSDRFHHNDRETLQKQVEQIRDLCGTMLRTIENWKPAEERRVFVNRSRHPVTYGEKGDDVNLPGTITNDKHANPADMLPVLPSRKAVPPPQRPPHALEVTVNQANQTNTVGMFPVSPSRQIVHPPQQPSETPPASAMARSGSMVSAVAKQMTRLSVFDHPVAKKNRRAKVFIDAEQMIQQTKKALAAAGDEKDPYFTSGLAQQIARSRTFDWARTVLIILNTLWMWIDTDLNDAVTLADASLPFVVVELSFSVWFFLEWCIIFAAFVDKWKCWRDMWFVFDTLLVAMMVLETWVFSLLAASMSNVRGISMLRLLRLTRISRCVRLLRVFPEVLIMFKAMVIGIRAIFFSNILMLGIVYIFAFIFTQLLDGKRKDPGTMARDKFDTVANSISTLLLVGMLPDQEDVMRYMGEQHILFYFLMLVYLYVATLTVTNMLTGILVEVINVVSAVEKEEILLEGVQGSLTSLVETSGVVVNHDGKITREIFNEILECPECSKKLSEVGVDTTSLVDLADVIYAENEHLSFHDFVGVILSLRNSSRVTVKDIVLLRKLIKTNHQRLNDLFDAQHTASEYVKDKLT